MEDGFFREFIFVKFENSVRRSVRWDPQVGSSSSQKWSQESFLWLGNPFCCFLVEPQARAVAKGKRKPSACVPSFRWPRMCNKKRKMKIWWTIRAMTVSSLAVTSEEEARKVLWKFSSWEKREKLFYTFFKNGVFHSACPVFRGRLERSRSARVAQRGHVRWYESRSERTVRQWIVVSDESQQGEQS